MVRKSLLSFFLVVFVLSTAMFAQDGQLFKWKSPAPQGNAIRFVKAFDANNWYMAGFSGLFMKTTNGGATFSFMQKAGVPNNVVPNAQFAIYDGHFFDVNTGVLVGQGGIRRTTDGGNTWTTALTTPSPSTTLYQVYFSTTNNGYACGTSGNLWKTTDAGASWTQIVSGTTLALYDVYSPDDVKILVSSTLGVIRTSTDAGVTWTAAVGLIGTPALYKMTFRDANNGIVTGSLSKAYSTSDGGATWTDRSVGLPASSSFYDVKFVADTVYLTGNSYALIKSGDYGATWAADSLLPWGQRWTSTFYATDFAGSKKIAGGAFGLIQVIDNGTRTGLTDLKKAGITYDIWSATGSQKVVAVGAPSVAGVTDQIMTSTDGGNSWFFSSTTFKGSEQLGTQFVPDEEQPVDNGKNQSPLSLSTFRSISMIDNNNGWIAGSYGAVYKTTNGGTSWDSVGTTGVTSTHIFYKVDFLDANTGWLFSNTGDTSGTVRKTTDGGATWNKYKIYDTVTTATHQIYAESRVGSNYLWVTNYVPFPLKSTDGGLTWQKQSLVDGWTAGFLYDIEMVDTLLGYSVGSGGKIYKTTNGGALWDTLSYTGKNTTVSWYSAKAIGSQYVMFAGSAGAIMFTTDGGTTWNWENTSSTVTNYAIQAGYPYTGSDTAAVYVGASSGSIFKMSMMRVPVELTNLSALVSGTTVTLNWSTATEVNNSGFDIERTSNNNSYAKIGHVNGNGTTTQTRNYSFVDQNLVPGVYNYRIKQIDYDGSSKYYELNVNMDINTPVSYSLSQNYPNPFNPATTIQYQIAKAGDVTLRVYDILGNLVSTLVDGKQEAGYYTVNFDASKLSSGVYFYQLKSGSFEKTFKMSLLK
jgi:photosystem II stability/assembly factor-like uncharacterized protein